MSDSNTLLDDMLTGSNLQTTVLEEVATIDTDRESRQGFPEVILAERKSPEEVAVIAQKLFAMSGRLLVTRASRAHFLAVQETVPFAHYHERGRVVYVQPDSAVVPHHIRTARIAVVTAGTSDLDVAHEARLTLEVAGVSKVAMVTDVGIAGIQRLIDRTAELRSADVLIVCAGMEGALPSVIGGLVRCPVVAVPTSVGYGASFGGMTALLGMVNACVSGLTVVNIDNGFGAGMAVIRMLSLRAPLRVPLRK